MKRASSEEKRDEEGWEAEGDEDEEDDEGPRVLPDVEATG